MATSIGGYNVIRLTGAPHEPAERVEVITRPGIDHPDYRTLGKVGQPFGVESVVDVDSNSDAQTRSENFAALVGTLVTVNLEHGTSHNNVMVLDVREVERRRVVGAVGGQTAGEFLLVHRWRLQLTE